MSIKLIYLGALSVLTFACQPSKKKENTTPQETTKVEDTLGGFRYDSITGKKYVTIDTFYLRDPKEVEEDIHNQFLK